ncbi:MAG: AtpZ/AtpI family protein [Acidobacteriota bacterium]
MKPKGRRESTNPLVQVSRTLNLAFILPVSSLVGYVIGWLLDKLFHTHFLYLVFLGFGMVAGLLEVLRTLNADARRDGD